MLCRCMSTQLGSASLTEQQDNQGLNSDTRFCAVRDEHKSNGQDIQEKAFPIGLMPCVYRCSDPWLSCRSVERKDAHMPNPLHYNQLRTFRRCTQRSMPTRRVGLRSKCQSFMWMQAKTVFDTHPQNQPRPCPCRDNVGMLSRYNLR